MTAASNKELVQRAFEANPFLGTAEAAAMREFYADEFVFSGPSTEIGKGNFDAFFDKQVELKEMIAEGDRVVVRWEGTAVHTDESAGTRPSTHRVAVSGITILRCADGRIVEGWGNLSWA